MSHIQERVKSIDSFNTKRKFHEEEKLWIGINILILNTLLVSALLTSSWIGKGHLKLISVFRHIEPLINITNPYFRIGLIIEGGVGIIFLLFMGGRRLYLLTNAETIKWLHSKGVQPVMQKKTGRILSFTIKQNQNEERGQVLILGPIRDHNGFFTLQCYQLQHLCKIFEHYDIVYKRVATVSEAAQTARALNTLCHVVICGHGDPISLQFSTSSQQQGELTAQDALNKDGLASAIRDSIAIGGSLIFQTCDFGKKSSKSVPESYATVLYDKKVSIFSSNEEIYRVNENVTFFVSGAEKRLELDTRSMKDHKKSTTVVIKSEEYVPNKAAAKMRRIALMSRMTPHLTTKGWQEALHSHIAD